MVHHFKQKKDILTCLFRFIQLFCNALLHSVVRFQDIRKQEHVIDGVIAALCTPDPLPSQLSLYTVDLFSQEGRQEVDAAGEKARQAWLQVCEYNRRLLESRKELKMAQVHG